PLRHGFYVREGVACGAVEWLPAELDPPIKRLGRNELSLNAGTGCTFVKVEETGRGVFAVDLSCTAAIGMESETYADRATFRILGRDRVEIAVADSTAGARAVYRFCPRTELPEPYRSSEPD